MNNFPNQPSPAKAGMGCLHETQTSLFSARDYITGDPFKIVRCNVCGTTVTMPRPADLSVYYPEAYYGSQDSERFPGPVEFLQDSLYASRVRQIENFTEGRKGTVLDVGCGRGLLLQQFQRSGWNVCGTELDDKSAAFPRDVLKLPIRIGELMGLDFPSEHFDVVVMWHVLEHVPSVAILLAEVSRILKPGGIFLIGVPNFGSIEAQITEASWFHLDVPRHLNHFTRQVLLRELASAGFVSQKISYFAPEYDSFSFVQSALNYMGFRQNLLYNFLRSSKAKVIQPEKISGLQLVLSLALAVPLGIFSLFFTSAMGLARRGATITIFAIKEHSGK